MHKCKCKCRNKVYKILVILPTSKYLYTTFILLESYSVILWFLFASNRFKSVGYKQDNSLVTAWGKHDCCMKWKHAIWILRSVLKRLLWGSPFVRLCSGNEVYTETQLCKLSHTCTRTFACMEHTHRHNTVLANNWCSTRPHAVTESFMHITRRHTDMQIYLSACLISTV